MIYVTADPHFYHENIIKYTNRPFSAFREMNAVMTENWNQSVGDDDEVYILGDLTMREGDVVEQLLENLHGRKYLVRGNHDYYAADYRGKSLEVSSRRSRVPAGRRQAICRSGKVMVVEESVFGLKATRFSGP